MIPDGNYNAVSPQAWAAACCFVQAVSIKIPSQGDDESQVLLDRLPCDQRQPLPRCQERIRAGRDAVVGKHRKLGQVRHDNISLEYIYSEYIDNVKLKNQTNVQHYQHEVQSLMAEELQSWNKSRLPLTLGFSQEEVDEALAGLEEMERELLEELSIMPEEVSVSDEELLRRQPALICPVCKLGTLRQTSQFQVFWLNSAA